MGVDCCELDAAAAPQGLDLGDILYAPNVLTDAQVRAHIWMYDVLLICNPDSFCTRSQPVSLVAAGPRGHPVRAKHTDRCAGKSINVCLAA
jgi:hypothetical protein